MNTQRMMILADLLDSLPEEKFELAYWVNDRRQEGETPDYVDLSVYDCNTTACIAGWAVALKNDLAVDNLYCGDVEVQAGDYLGLNRQEMQRLFFYGLDTIWSDHADELGCESPYDYTVTNKMAAKAVRNIAQGKWELV